MDGLFDAAEDGPYGVRRLGQRIWQIEPSVFFSTDWPDYRERLENGDCDE
jgi:hypothetical protein